MSGKWLRSARQTSCTMRLACNSGIAGKRCMERRHSGVSAKQRRHPEPKGNQPGGLGLPEREQPALGH